MRLPSVFLAGSLVAASVGAAQAGPVRQIVPQGAPSFTSQSAGFAIRLPAKPTESRKVLPAGIGESLTTSNFQARTDSILYLVTVSPTLPSVDLTAPTHQLDNVQNGFLQTSRAILQKREELQLGEIQGRELKASVKGGTITVRGRIFFTPQAYYSVFASGLKGAMQAKTAQIDDVFASFRILPRIAAPSVVPLFVSKKFGFSAQLPVKPLEREQDVPLPDGQHLNVSMFVAPTEGATYVILITEVEAEVTPAEATHQLDLYEKGLLATVKAKSPAVKVLNRADIELDSFPGTELTVSLPEQKATSLIRFYLTPGGIYTLIVNGLSADLKRQNARVQSVFESFHIEPQ